MRRCLIPVVIAVVLGALAGWGHAAITYSGSSGCSATTGTTCVTGSISTIDGDVAVAVFSDRIGGTTPTIGDSCSRSWTALTGAPTTSTVRYMAWYAPSTSTCSMTVTFTTDSSGNNRAGAVAVWSGAAASPLDTNPTVNTDGTSPYVGPASGSLAQAGEVVVGMFAHTFIGAGDDVTCAEGTTSLAIVQYQSNTSALICYAIVTSTSSVTPSATTSGTNRVGVNGTASFKAATAATIPIRNRALLGVGL